MSYSQEILSRSVTVCNACLCASCWQGLFYCDEAKGAGTTERTVAQLLEGNVRESLEHWFRDPNTGRVNQADVDACRAAIAARKPAHQESGACWCHPTLDYTNAETGAQHWIHHEPN